MRGAFGDELVQALADGRVDDLVEPGADLGVVAVADRLEEEVAQRVALERLAEHVEDLAVVGLALLLDLGEQLGEDGAFPGVGRDEVPQVADLGLADAVDAAEALLDPVRVPREVVVDHEVGALEVQALAGGVGRDQDPGVDVLGEQLFSLGALISPDAAVDGDDGVAAAEEIADALGEVLQGVAVLGEDDDLLTGDHRVVGEQLAELGPLLVRAAVPDPARELDQVGEEREFLVELGDRAGGGGGVGDLRLDLLGLLAGQVVAVHGARVGQVGLGGILAEQVAQAPGEVVVGRSSCCRSASRCGASPGACGVVRAT